MRALALLALACASACTPDFAAPSAVTDLRILAVQAEPPEAQYDDAGVDPVQLHVLAVDPRDAGSIVLHAQLCARTDSRRCDGGPTLDLGEQPLSATLLVPPEVVSQARNSDDLKGLGGIRVQYSFSVQDDGPKVYGSKVLLFSPRGGTPNRNPVLSQVNLTRDGQPFGVARPGDTVVLPGGVEIGLRPVLADGSREHYVTTDLRGNLVTLQEQPRYSFYVTPGGEFSADTADEPLDGGAPPDGLSRLTGHSGDGGLWIVVRDGRGGESWTELRWSVAATPISSQSVRDRPARR
jgi:hypothetical protein